MLKLAVQHRCRHGPRCALHREMVSLAPSRGLSEAQLAVSFVCGSLQRWSNLMANEHMRDSFSRWVSRGPLSCTFSLGSRAQVQGFLFHGDCADATLTGRIFQGGATDDAVAGRDQPSGQAEVRWRFGALRQSDASRNAAPVSGRQPAKAPKPVA
jgi:hypothetical protein